MKLKFVIINGFPQSGKDTFVTMCGEFSPTVSLWTSTPAKQALKTLGWDGTTKTPEIRKLLSHFKEISVKNFDGVLTYLRDEIEYMLHLFRDDTYIVFIHSREPEEIKRLVKEFDATTLLILRGINKEELSNDSDRNVLDYQYDYTVDNNDDMNALKLKAMDFVSYMEVK